MARRSALKKLAKTGPLQSLIDREQLEAATAPLVSRFAEQHGDYSRNLRFVVNNGSTTVGRWKTAKALSPSQEAAIVHCQNLWAKLGSQCLVVDFEKVRGLGHGDGYSQHEAFAQLGRIQGHFPGPLQSYWNVFENVCRHDLPAGVAGSRLANNKRSSMDAARIVVCFVADIIAMKERLSY